jgi:phosphoglucomutase
LAEVLDLEVIRGTNLRLGVDPLGGAGVHYWPAIAEHYGLDLTVVDDVVDPTFGFMSVDWDGKIRMDPSSPYAMQRLIGLKGRFDIAVACDTDHDRHGIVTKTGGLMTPNHYLAVLVDYLFRHRDAWGAEARIGKTAVTTHMIERIATQLDRQVYETPVGFKWFVDGLLDGGLGAGVEESAGASFLRRDGSVWTTDKDGIVAGLLAAEITARTGRDPSEHYEALAAQLGAPAYRRVDAPASPAQKAALARLSPEQARCEQLAGERVGATVSQARGNGAPLGGVKVMTDSAWFAARPSGTENVYKIYAESFRGEAHLQQVLEEAQAVVDGALAASSAPVREDAT